MNNIIYLPPELIELILSFINDTKTYCNSRLVCKEWYNILKVIKIFKYNMLIKKMYFKPDLIEFIDTNNKLVGSVIFKEYGSYIYTDGKTEIEATPFKLRKKYTTMSCIEHIKYNILKDEKLTRYITLPGCSIS